MRLLNLFRIGTLILLLTGAVLWAQPQQPAASALASTETTGEYLISPDDVLDVFILDVVEMSRQYRVSPVGEVKVPLLPKPVKAVGLTLEQFSDALAAELRSAGLVSNPQVTTAVKESRVHAVAITGAVKKPQIYPVLARTTLLDMLSQAEGINEDASNTAVIRRGPIAQAALGLQVAGDAPAEQREAVLTTKIDVKQLLESGDPTLNPDIYPGDRITVPRAGIVYVVGAVNQPGGYPVKTSKQGTTVLQAIALAKDLKSTAQRKKSFIIRADQSTPDGRLQIPVDLSKVLAGKSPDPVLQAEDILFIPDSTGKKALRRGLESAIQAATGIAIYGRY